MLLLLYFTTGGIRKTLGLVLNKQTKMGVSDLNLKGGNHPLGMYRDPSISSTSQKYHESPSEGFQCQSSAPSASISFQGTKCRHCGLVQVSTEGMGWFTLFSAKNCIVLMEVWVVFNSQMWLHHGLSQALQNITVEVITFCISGRNKFSVKNALDNEKKKSTVLFVAL